MTLKQLLEQYSANARRLTVAEKEVHRYRERGQQLADTIQEEIKTDFARFLEDTFADLPPERQITDWYVRYVDTAQGKPYIQIGVEKIGGKAKWAGVFDEPVNRLPEQLRAAEAFGREYPIEVRVNHIYEQDDIK